MTPARTLVLALLFPLAACSDTSAPPPAPAAAIRLVESELAPADWSPPAQKLRRPVAWSFDEAKDGGTLGWQAGPGTAGLAVRRAALTGRAANAFPVVWVTRETGDITDQRPDERLVERIEVEMRVSGGSQLAWLHDAGPLADVGAFVAAWRTDRDPLTVPLARDGEKTVYRIEPPFTLRMADIGTLLLRPTDAADATFEIASVTIHPLDARLGGIAPGVGWHHLGQVYKETLAAKAPETLVFDVDLPAAAHLHVSIGTPQLAPATFSVTADGQPLLTRVVTTPDRWEDLVVDLTTVGAGPAKLELSLSGTDGVIGLWGAPVVRSHGSPMPKPVEGTRRPPRGVILVMADTLRPDHLQPYGYERPTAPRLAELAQEGTLFTDCVSAGTWTKVATPSLLTGIYPRSLGIAEPSDRVPAAVDTLAEVYRAHGYATLSLSSVMFTGRSSNLHQGFETLHEVQSIPRRSPKTSRTYVDRLIPWLEQHRRVPFFVFLHVFDPHDPYEPDAPWDAAWADPGRRARQEQDRERAKEHIGEKLLKRFGMPRRDDLVAAGIDSAAFVQHEQDWYDGSILGMDAEIGRLVNALAELGLDDDVLLVFTSDHGEEFYEHGRMFHGQTVYGELAQVPLLARWPGGVAAERTVDQTVRSIDVVPTLLELSRLPVPAAVQGRSLVPVLTGDATGRLSPEPAVVEKAATTGEIAPPPRETESYAIVFEGWKLVHNAVRTDEAVPEYQLFDHRTDPLDAHDLAAEHPDIVAKLVERLAVWHQRVEAERLMSDAEAAAELSPEEIEQLKALGYLR